MGWKPILITCIVEEHHKWTNSALTLTFNWVFNQRSNLRRSTAAVDLSITPSLIRNDRYEHNSLVVKSLPLYTEISSSNLWGGNLFEFLFAFSLYCMHIAFNSKRCFSVVLYKEHQWRPLKNSVKHVVLLYCSEWMRVYFAVIYSFRRQIYSKFNCYSWLQMHKIRRILDFSKSRLKMKHTKCHSWSPLLIYYNTAFYCKVEKAFTARWRHVPPIRQFTGIVKIN
jgi:hypothetical protein